MLKNKFFRTRAAFLWAIAQRVVIISYRRFGTTYLQEVFPQTYVRNYHYSLRNNPEERDVFLTVDHELTIH